MAEATTASSFPLPNSRSRSRSLSSSWLTVLVVISPIAVSFLVYRFDEFDAAPIPPQAWNWSDVISAPKQYDHVLNDMEKIGEGLLPGPEDLVCDEESGAIYTGCSDGWIKRITLAHESAAVENWVHVGGRPLGLAFGPDKQLFVTDALKGLLKVTREGLVEVLTNEVEGLKFGLANGVDVAQNGVIYFTDTSYKYNISNFMLNTLEGRPYGRLISFDPLRNHTQVLLQNLYFPNGVAISPQQDFVVFCETLLRRCRRYYVKGEKTGVTEDFVDRLPGFPDNIHYDGEGKFWIALISGRTTFWSWLHKYPSLRKTAAILTRYIDLPHVASNGGVMTVNLDGEPISFYTDPDFFMVSSGVKIRDDLYIGSLAFPYIRRPILSYFDSNIL